MYSMNKNNRLYHCIYRLHNSKHFQLFVFKPNNLVTGGITGLSLTIGKVINMNYTYIYYGICILILIGAKIILGIKEVKIILLSTTYPLILILVNNIKFNFYRIPLTRY